MNNNARYNNMPPDAGAVAVEQYAGVAGFAGQFLTGANESVPEFLMAGCRTNSCDKKRVIPGVMLNKDDRPFWRAADHRYCGTIGQYAAILKALFALGISSDTETALAGAGATQTAVFLDSTPLSVGFELDWATELQLTQPFTLDLVTTNWGSAQQRMTISTTPLTPTPVNRSFRIRMDCGGERSGRIYVPWAMRVNPSMEVSQPVIAVVSLADVANVGQGTITVQNIPTSLQNRISFKATLLTAFGQQTSDFMQRIGFWSGQERPMIGCSY
jgi:hypothetical protein